MALISDYLAAASSPDALAIINIVKHSVTAAMMLTLGLFGWAN